MPTHEILGSKITVDQMYDKILSQTEPQQVLASGSEFLLIKLDALTSTKKIFSNKNEWFWLSEQTPRWAIGNCYDLITSKQSKTASKEPLTLQEIENYQSLKSQLRNLLQEEDLCFSTNNQRYGYKMYIHPLVSISVSRTTSLRYSGNSISSLSSNIKGPENGLMIENRVTEKRVRVLENNNRQALVVVASAVWSSFVSIFLSIKKTYKNSYI